MPKYSVEIKEVLRKNVEVEADNENDAVTKVQDQYSNQDIVLDSSDFDGDVEFSLIGETEVEL